MAALKAGVREFRERIATFLESDTPVAVTRRGGTLGVYVPRGENDARQRSFLNSKPPLTGWRRPCPTRMKENS
jgi:hypothetical protein